MYFHTRSRRTQLVWVKGAMPEARSVSRKLVRNSMVGFLLRREEEEASYIMYTLE